MNSLLKLALLTAFGLGTQGISASAVAAATFGQQDLNPDRVIAIASPVGTRSHQLLILEQLSDRRPCWREDGDAVDPLLLEFDFTGICGRGTDSNGYSLRVGGEDLGWRYSLRIVPSGNTLRLVASSNTNRSEPPIEVGRATVTNGEMVEIELNSGWRLTKRVYNGQTLGHYYLTHDQPLETLVAAAPSPNPTPIIPTPQPTPLVPRSPAPVVPTQPLAPPADAPRSTPTPAPSPSPAPRPTPGPTPVSPNFDGPPPPPSEYASRLGFSYRVVVPASNSSVQSRVRAVVPDAFRTTINGAVMMQAGLFRDRTDAEVLKQRLRLYNLDANILEVAVTEAGDSGSNTPQPDAPSLPPSVPPRQPAPAPELPRIPATRTVIVIDPGHGGRD
ncbi:MAG: DUF3747 domain-containing protein, partial [Synechococcales bacterium]|nr:DUF3747 domain-containing protein [Synechococcales bacterium]